MREAIAWSVDLLAPAERALFRRLAVLPGGFTAAAAQVVGEAAGPVGIDVLDGIGRLVGSSLMRPVDPETDDAEPRFAMLDTVREYGEDDLEASGESDATRWAFATWCLALVEQSVGKIAGTAGRTDYEAVAAEYPNLRAALAWAFLHGHAELGARLALALSRFWFVRGPVSEGRAWLERVLAAAAGFPAVLRVEALLRASELAHCQRDAAAAAALAAKGGALAQAIGDEGLVAQGRFLLGVAARMLGETDRAADLLGAALRSFRARGDAVWAACALNNLALLAQATGDRTRAAHFAQEAVDMLRRERAEAVLAGALNNLAGLALEDGDTGRVAVLAEEALTLFHAHGDRLGVADVLSRLASVALRRGEPAAAARLLATTDALRSGDAVPPSVTDRVAHQGAVSASRTLLGETAFSHAWATGGSATLDESIGVALRVARQEWSNGTPSAVKGDGGVSLTRREREVLRLVAAGFANREVAAALFVSPRTVMAHVQHIFAKLGVRTRKDAATLGRDRGLV